jgi:hypothetical protein
MVIGLEFKGNVSYAAKTNLFDFSEKNNYKQNLSNENSPSLFNKYNNSQNTSVSVFGNADEDKPGAEKIKKDEADGFRPKDIFDIDKFFVKMLKSAIGPAMTYLISECAFNKCDKDGNKVLTSDEYSELITNFDINPSNFNQNDNQSGNNFLKNILDLLSGSSAENSSLMKIPGVSDIKDAFVNTLKMMIGIDTNNNGIIEKNEFSALLDEKTSEKISEESKDKLFSTLSSSQKSGQAGLDLGSFTNFAFDSKLAWDPDKKINTQEKKK